MVMGVRSEKVDQVAVEPHLHKALRLLSKATRVGLSGDLDQTSTQNPIVEQFGPAADHPIALGVGDDRDKACHLNFVEHSIELLRDELVSKLHKNVIGTVDGEIPPMLDKPANVIVGKVEVTPQEKLWRIASGSLEFFQPLLVELWPELVSVITMRGGDEVGNAVGSGHLTHSYGDFQGRRPVVNS